MLRIILKSSLKRSPEAKFSFGMLNICSKNSSSNQTNQNNNQQLKKAEVVCCLTT